MTSRSSGQNIVAHKLKFGELERYRMMLRNSRKIIGQKKRKMNPRNDLTQLIERLEAFEERCGIRLEALFAIIDPDGNMGGGYTIHVNGEIYPREGTALEKDISLQFGAYDKSGRLVASSLSDFKCDGFFGFETFSAMINSPITQISKIRIHPRFSQ